MFADPLALAIEDAIDPGRTVLVGISERQRVLLTVYTDVDEDAIRIIQRTPRDLAREKAL